MLNLLVLSCCIVTALTVDDLHYELEPKFATPCTTPNDDVGVCIEIQQCTIFMQALSSKNNISYDFIRESRCGPKNENSLRPKVCCGIHVDYVRKQVSNTTYRIDVEPMDPLPKVCGKQIYQLPSRILGGTAANLEEFPWMARLRHRRKDGLLNYGCAGFLISRWFVLTAAHCIRAKALEPIGPLFQVQLGEYNTQNDPDCKPIGNNKFLCADSPQLIKTAKPILHPEYSGNGQQHNDIAVIPLKEPANLTDYVFPICLANQLSNQTEMWLSGWGKTEFLPSSPVKLKVLIRRVDKEDCIKKYKNLDVQLLHSQICAGGEKDRDSCSGDSGGPLMVQKGIGPWYAEGIVSFGLGCGLEDWPGIYTSVPDYFPWIKRVMNRYLRKHARNFE